MIKLITPLIALGLVATPAMAQTTNTAQSNSTEQTTKVATKTTHVSTHHRRPVRHHRRVRRVHHHVVKKTVVTKTTTHS